MRISVEFDSMEEFEQFRVSGKATRRSKKDDEPTPEEVAEKQAAMAQSIRDAQPLAAQPAPPLPQQQPISQGFPGGNGQMPAPQHRLVNAILARIDGALTSGQAPDAIVNWFRQQIGPIAKDATLEQIKQVFVPRMSEMELKQLAPQLGIPTE
jgi:hypothetical protein